MEEKFKVGDRVKGLGLYGTVRESSRVNTLTGFPITVKFDNGLEYPFTSEGSFFEKAEPCLELVERPNKKVKRTYYKAYYQINKSLSPIYESLFYEDKSKLLEFYLDRIVLKFEEREFEIEE